MERGDVLVTLLRDKPHAVGAEIGVRAGETTLKLLEGLPGLRKLWCVDPFEEYAEYTASEGVRQDWLDQVNWQFLERCHPYWARLFILRTYSVPAAQCVPDESLDFVFIDACHEYDYVKADILAWEPKVKPGGLISGHDYSHPPVGRAVHEILGTLSMVPPEISGAGHDDVWIKWK